MKKFFNILLGIVIAIFIAVALLLLISSLHLQFLPLDARTVLTGSMEPAIPTGSIVFIYPQAEYIEGDIITFRRADSDQVIPVTHRVVTITEGEIEREFITKGDANDYQDLNAVKESEVYGQVIFHLPYIGYLLDAAKTPWGFAAFIVIPAALVIADEVKKIIGYMRRREDEKEEIKEEE